MEQKKRRRTLDRRIKMGEVRQRDVKRGLAELAFGKVNDCVRLALEDKPDLDRLDLRMLSEVKRNEKGLVEIKLVDRLRALEQLAQVAGEDREDMEAFLRAVQGGEGT